MRIFSKKKGNDWIFWVVAILLFCIMGAYVFYALNLLVKASEITFGDGGSSGTLIEHFDFATLEQVLGNRLDVIKKAP